MGFFDIFKSVKKEPITNDHRDDDYWSPKPKTWQISYVDGTLEKFVGGEFDVDEHYIMFRDLAGYGVLYTPTSRVAEVRLLANDNSVPA